MRTATELWSAFWRTAGDDGCTLAFPPHRRAALAQRWHDLLSPQPKDGALLDVACGRGAVLAQARAAGWRNVQGVDAAAPHALHGADPAIRGGVDARALPFADRAFAVVTSQFGIEYASVDVAGIEAARVCQARLILLVHAADGIVVAQAREQAEQARWIDEGLDGFTVLGRAAAEDPGADAALAAALGQVTVCAGEAGNVAMLDGFHHTATALAGARDASAVAVFRDEWRDHAARLGEMVAAAPTPAALDGLARRLTADGFAVEITNEGGGEPLIGRWLVARRGEMEQ